MTAMIKVKRTKDGAINCASLSSLGAMIPDGSIPDGALIRGGLKLTGRIINPNTLPFYAP
jgi:hypothetical protein